MIQQDKNLDSSVPQVCREWSLRDYLTARAAQLAREAQDSSDYSYNRITELALIEKLLDDVDEFLDMENAVIGARVLSEKITARLAKF